MGTESGLKKQGENDPFFSNWRCEHEIVAETVLRFVRLFRLLAVICW